MACKFGYWGAINAGRLEVRRRNARSSGSLAEHIKRWWSTAESVHSRLPAPR